MNTEYKLSEHHHRQRTTKQKPVDFSKLITSKNCMANSPETKLKGEKFQERW